RAGRAGVKRDVEPDVLIEAAAAPRAPGAADGADHAHSRVGPEFGGARDGQGQVAGLDRTGRREGWGRPGGFHFQYGDIGAWIATSAGRGQFAVVGQDHAEIVVTLQAVLRRDHDARAPDYSTGRDAFAPVDCDYERRRPFDGPGQVVGQRC